MNRKENMKSSNYDVKEIQEYIDLLPEGNKAIPFLESSFERVNSLLETTGHKDYESLKAYADSLPEGKDKKMANRMEKSIRELIVEARKLYKGQSNKTST